MSRKINEIIHDRRRELGMSQIELAKQMRAAGIDVTNQAVCKWENASTQPNAEQFLALCRVLDIEDIRGEFSDGDEGIFAGLNKQGRNKALDYLHLLRASGLYEIMHEPIKLRTLPLYSLAVSAGTGQFLDGEDYEMVEVGEEVAEGANFGVRVAGNSMEPEFHDGEIIWVHQQRSLMTGDIGIFLYDGSAYLKQLVAKKNSMALHSLNPEYSDIIVSPELPLRVLGKVLR